MHHSGVICCHRSASLFYKWGPGLSRQASVTWIEKHKSNSRKCAFLTAKLSSVLHKDRAARIQTYPRPRARMCEMSKDGMKTLRNSAEKKPPFFMTPLFLILRDTERRGCLKWNSLRGIMSPPINAKLFQETIRGQYPEQLLLNDSGCGSVFLLWWNVFWSAGPISDPVYFFIH